MAYGRAPGAFETTPVQVPTGQVPLIADSGRKAIKLAEKALFGRERPAKERIHWLFSPDQDERVTSMLKWVSIMSDALATLGFQKFLREGQRGALICNADFRVTPIPGGPPQPAFDWINIDTVQATLDRIMQESVIAYNPSLHTVVFVFLLSASRNSMAIWRRKVPIPEALRDKYRDEIQKVMDSLDPKYQVYLDEYVELSSLRVLIVLTLMSRAPAPPPKKKKGFWRRLFGR
ncbi:hypothetical protein K474DRAFT_1587043 [Panus rudis PR-1116 ss-1]|nr:hypothetical protein K474DRAFT_1587043 [Panus rudis PR-1116 ss-1]